MKIIILHRNSFDVVGGVESTIYYIAIAASCQVKKLRFDKNSHFLQKNLHNGVGCDKM